MKSHGNRVSEPIAIIGSSCRFPGGATSPSKLWELLQDPKDALVDIPSDRFSTNKFYHTNGNHHGSTNVTQSYLCTDDYRKFDHTFFGIHRREAEAMDPQQRILLELVYEGIESAGYSMDGLKGSKTGVFVGQMTDDYYNILYKDMENIPQYTATGGSRAIMANRVSYFFDWRGPSMNTDTACSSSLVALHQAVQALRSGESPLAIAAGVNLIIGPEAYIAESKLRMLSPTGRSRMWDADADGYARGEGFAVVVLKTLKHAIADGDHIECIIREVGVNQDGRSSGLTVPNPTAQTELIRSTYNKCGLDYRKKEERCQYFEAHGTGTLAGDPREAEAIRDAFFPSSEPKETEEDDHLYVGSVKTIIGHSEGTAGLAALLKASLAVQNGKIPPNMHFNRLNPAIEPFYKNLCVPTELLPWPKLPPGTPRRVSVNSFGFGGTNAHAIVESWEGLSSVEDSNSIYPWGPFTVSAHSESALIRMASSLSSMLKNSHEIDLADLAWTLQNRRTRFPCKAAISASHKTDLIESLDAIAEIDTKSRPNSFSGKVIQISEKFPLRILGVFTGQGAQWPSMGAGLYRHSDLFRKSIHKLEESLRELPVPPSWSLAEELTAPKESSRVHLAEISQPLCTALQVALVDLLQASGVTFAAVVGHSSGEIAAAYAAGYLTADDAIRISYYRGLYSHLAGASNDQPGRMMAVEMSTEEASEFCLRNQFSGRIKVAAYNSKSSITLSGDADAIEEAKAVLDAERTFARVLKVDKAYHSHHMLPCSIPYLESLRHCNIEPQRRSVEGNCTWYSSVYGPDGRSINDPDSFSGKYWVDNLVQPVQFYQAMDRALKEDYCLDLALEVGPHPALQGPATDTIRALTGTEIPYKGVLRREDDDVRAFTDALGHIWSNVQSPDLALDLNAFREACCVEDVRKPRLLKGLAPYAWDHDELLFKESSISKAWRTDDQPIHELLGRDVSQGNGFEFQWRNILRINEVEWLRGHQFQHQVLFPAAGYVSMAIEACSLVSSKQSVQVIELQDLRFLRAISLEESSAVEVRFALKVTHRDTNRITAEFACYSTDADAGKSQRIEHTNSTGHATMILGSPSPDVLPPRIPTTLPLTDVDTGRFYSWVSDIGLQYDGDFMVTSIRRRLNLATVTLRRPQDTKLRVHPATLDAAFHGVFAGHGFPDDGRMRIPYLPSKIDLVRVNMATAGIETPYTQARGLDGAELLADCHVQEASATEIIGDVDLFGIDERYHHPHLQVQGLACTSFNIPTKRDDRTMFARTIWSRDITCGLEPMELPAAPKDYHISYDVFERTAYYYIRQLCKTVSEDEVPAMEWHLQALFDWCLNHVVPRVKGGNHPRVKSEWASDTREDVMSWKAQYPDRVELELLIAFGEKLPEIVRGRLPTLQVLMENNMLYRMYKDGQGAPEANCILGSLISQLSHRYPKMKVLEIGAGTGGATGAALKSLASTFESYTFTDISAGFFGKAQELFAEYEDHMRYATLDIERSPVEQGFEKNSYDLVIAANVLHATKSLSQTLKNCRDLLRPGGYLLLLELTGDSLYLQFTFSGLSGWWLGREDGRIWHPTVSESRWNAVLRESGFSGVDYAARDVQDNSRYVFSVMCGQAIDPRVEFLREPLSVPDGMVQMDNLIIVGGPSLEVTTRALRIQSTLSEFASSTHIVSSWEELEVTGITPGSSVICLAELDEAALERVTEQRLRAIQSIFHDAKHILWVTRGALAEKPMANMMVGIGRSIMMESPHLRIQFVDINEFQNRKTECSMLSEMALRLVSLGLEDWKDIMWSSETEVAFINGDLYIQRILPDVDLNNRLNSERRSIENKVQLASVPVNIVRKGDLITLQEIEASAETHYGHNAVPVRVYFSALYPFVSSDNMHIYISIGVDEGSRQMVIGLSQANASTLKLPRERVIPLGGKETLSRLVAVVLCEDLLANVSGAVWFHDLDVHIMDLVLQVASEKGVEIFFSTSSANGDKRAAYIHPSTTRRALEPIIPRNLKRFVYMGTANECDIGNLLHSSRRSKVEVRHLRMDTNDDHCMVSKLSSNDILGIMRREAKFCSDSTRLESTVCVSNLSSLSGPQDPLTVIDWTSTDTVPVQIHPLTLANMFSDQKTYLLVGLASEVGMSLVEWMTDNGAKNFAIASRNPKIDPQMLRHIERKGANIKIFAFDIADKQALQAAHRDILSSMPPIAGVANAGMVLRDKSFTSMNLEELQVVLGPKVQGSKNLDELFYKDDLDFFILFSSMSSIIGNAGQSNYGAANMFMSSLAAQRRKRGVAASVIHLAMLLGIGHVQRSLDTGSTIESQLRKFSFESLSELDLHVIFAEAIVSGRPGGSADPSLLTGFGNKKDAAWRRLPRFAHFPSTSDTSVVGRRQTQTSNSIKTQLYAVSNRQESFVILEAAFASKLGMMLQTPGDKIDKSVPLVTLGIDSLVAVEARSWFLKELGIDMPILKMLGGASLSDISRDALAKLPHHQTLTTVVESSGAIDEEPSISSPFIRDIDSDDIQISVPGSAVTSSISNGAMSDTQSSDLEASILSLRPKGIYERMGDMSHAQARLFFLHEYLDDKSTYNVGYLGAYHGKLDPDKLRSAITSVSKQHESLRTSYFIDHDTDRPVQAVNQNPSFILEFRQIQGDEELQSEVELQRKFVFNIENGQLLKVTVLSRSPTLHHIIFLHHHIALDGVSWLLFMDNLQKAYSGESLNIPSQQAIDMSAKQRASNIPSNLKDKLSFWAALYERPHEPLPMFPFSKVKNRQILTAYDTETSSIDLGPDLSRRIREKAASLQITSFHFYLAAFAVFLARCLAVDDFGIGIVDANRTDAEDAETLGYFLNMLPLRFRLDQSECFHELAKKTRDMVFSALSNSQTPFDAILDHLHVSRSGNHHPLFQAALNYRQGYSVQTQLGSGVIEWSAEGITARNPYDLSVDITEVSGRTLIHWSTQKYMYTTADSRLIMKWYAHVIQGLVDDPYISIACAPVSNESELMHAFSLGVGDSVGVEWTGTIVHRIEEMSNRHPDATALVDGYGNRLTYSQMMSRVYQISRDLRSRLLAPGSYVGMLLHPMADHVCTFLAIMQVGHICVPLDLRNHMERLSAMISDCRPPVIICNGTTMSQAETLAGQVNAQILHLDELSVGTNGNVGDSSQANDVAVLLYTSGSTGVPKGVMVSHGNIVNHIFGNTMQYGVGQEVILQQSSLGFDLSLDQTFTALANGGTLVIASKDDRGDPTRIAQLMVAENITYTLCCPSEYLTLLNYGFRTLQHCNSWRFAFSLGEKLTQQVRRGFQKLDLDQVQLINAYGPTEATIACSRGQISYQTEAEIAAESDNLWTMPNYTVLVMDQNMNALPVGFPGEICIGGGGVAMGYLNRPEETDQRFVDVDLSSVSGGRESLSRIYRTGDFGRLLEDGSLHILGRMNGDSQVKIHGIRVELGEIASSIIHKADGAITNAAVSYRPEPDVLVAYVVFDASFNGDETAFTTWLKANLPLPAYMCPSIMAPVREIPINVNGKEDRTAIDMLPIPAITKRDPSSEVNLNPAELRMKQAWQEVLPDSTRHSIDIAPNSDFFQVGGNSLMILKLRSVIQKTFSITVSLAELFQLATLRKMASRVQVSTLDDPFDESIDWSAEVEALLQGITYNKGLASETKPKSGLKILLTGSTGFLGTRVLKLLVDEAGVSEVHCVAIRSDSRGNPRHCSVASEKIIQYPGDLSSPRLGLSDAQFEHLSRNVDVIIHNGAQVSFMKSYQSLRMANVVATRTLCELALARRIPIHFVSSAAVASLSQIFNGAALPEISVSDRLPQSDATDGYALSKWVSESLLEEVSLRHHVPVWIHRSTTIIGEGAPDLDLMTSILRFSAVLEAVPAFDSQVVQGVFDFVDVEVVANSLVQTTLESIKHVNEHNHHSSVRFIHYCNDSKIKPGELHEYMESTNGKVFEKLSIDNWLDLALEKGLSPVLYAFLSRAAASASRITLPVIERAA